jgi:hypothetical protein
MLFGTIDNDIVDNLTLSAWELFLLTKKYWCKLR